jgi:hypothetical protein
MLVGMRSILILAGLVVSLVAASQEIYRWVDKDGVVHYSDQPGADNAVLITVLEPNLSESGESGAASGGADTDRPAARDAPEYESLAIITPTPDQVFFGADAVVSATAELDGTLQPDHTVVFFLNGNRHEATGLGTEFTNLARGSYFLRASVVDQDGRPVISSPQTTFHVRQPSINSPQSPQAPPPPRPRPRPLPQPASPR